MRTLWALLLTAATASAYVEAPMPLASVIAQSTNVCTMVISKVDKQKNLIVYRKVSDVKGKHPQDEIKHNIGFGGLRPGEWQEIMNWAEVGKPAVFFHNGGASETYIGATWYQAYPQGEWWGMSHGEPFLMRSYCGKVDKLGGAVADLIAGKEILIPCMVDGDKEALHKKTAKVQRVRAKLSVQDYNPKRDFAGWGGEDIRRLAGMPGFDRLAALGSLGADAQAVSAVDFDLDGKLDLCLVGAHKVMLFQNGGDAFTEVSLPNFSGGARSAVWADYNGDGLPDLLLATQTGPRLFTNLGKGQFRDDTKLLPREAAYNLTAAAWIDADADGHPDILLANGFHGVSLYRNARGKAAAKPKPPTFGAWHAIGPFRAANPADNLATAFAPEADADLAKTHKGKRDTPVKWEAKAFADGQAHALTPFGGNCAVYLVRTVEAGAAMSWPVSFVGGKGFAVWLNGTKIHTSANGAEATIPLALKAGANRLLVKAVQAEGEWNFKFTGSVEESGAAFEDVSAAWGLGADIPKGDSLTVADFNGDGKADFLYGAGDGMLFVNAGNRFTLKADSGLKYRPGKVGPAVVDFDGDGKADLFIPQVDGRCQLCRNDGTGRFGAVPGGDLAKPIPGAVGAAWGDFDNDGKPDLIVCVLRGPNRYFHNNGDGTFTDQTVAVGLNQKQFNSQAACLADLNNDGRLDVIFANEQQDSAILFGSLATEAKKTPLTVHLAGAGGRVVVKANGQSVASATATGADGRGGQSGLAPRFALAPGSYTVEVTGSDGRTKSHAVTLALAAVQLRPADGK